MRRRDRIVVIACKLGKVPLCIVFITTVLGTPR